MRKLLNKKFWLFICLYLAWATILTPIFNNIDDEGFQIILAAPFTILTVYLWNKIDNKFFIK